MQARWTTAELKIDHGGDACGLGNGVHLTSLLQVHGDRLLAEDVLASGDGGEHDLAVRRGRDCVQFPALDAERRQECLPDMGSGVRELPDQRQEIRADCVGRDGMPVPDGQFVAG